MRADAPTLHVTNWSSRKLHGPGRKFTIMAAPRHWERGDGLCWFLTPSPLLWELVWTERIDLTEYRRQFKERLATRRQRGELQPGELFAAHDGRKLYLRDGDTLCCACSRDRAAAGECHRVWAATALARAGWRVILDGKELKP